MKLDRRHLLASAAAAGAIGLTSCSRSSGAVQVWAMGVEGEALGTLAERFMRDRGTEVVVQALPWSSAHEKLLTAFAADSLPDVLALGNTWVPEFVALDALEPLEPFVAAHRIDLNKDFAVARRSVTIADKLYGLPWYVDTRLLYYRRDLLKAAGFDRIAVTRSEWDRQLSVLSRAGHGLLMPINEYEPLVAFSLQAGAPLLLDNGTRGGFRQPAVRQAFAYVASLYDRGFAPVVTNTEVPDIYGSFARGDFAFLISGPWNLGEFAERLPASMQDAWATAPLPGLSGAGASLAGGVSLCLMRASRNKARAFAVIDYICNARQQQILHRTTGDLPADQTAWFDTGLMRDPRSKAFFDQLMIAKPPPMVPEWERIANEMATALERIVRGVEPLDAALARLDAFADAVLAKRRWMLGRAQA
jgi:multiple sugar transport system substrate-binding protein